MNHTETIAQTFRRIKSSVPLCLFEMQDLTIAYLAAVYLYYEMGVSALSDKRLQDFCMFMRLSIYQMDGIKYAEFIPESLLIDGPNPLEKYPYEIKKAAQEWAQEQNGNLDQD